MKQHELSTNGFVFLFFAIPWRENISLNNFEISINFNTFAMKYSELKKVLRANNCMLIRQGAKHEIWYSPKTGRHFPVGRHDAEEVYIKTLKDIVKQSGIVL